MLDALVKPHRRNVIDRANGRRTILEARVGSRGWRQPPSNPAHCDDRPESRHCSPPARNIAGGPRISWRRTKHGRFSRIVRHCVPNSQSTPLLLFRAFHWGRTGLANRLRHITSRDNGPPQVVQTHPLHVTRAPIASSAARTLTPSRWFMLHRAVRYHDVTWQLLSAQLLRNPSGAEEWRANHRSRSRPRYQ